MWYIYFKENQYFTQRKEGNAVRNISVSSAHFYLYILYLHSSFFLQRASSVSVHIMDRSQDTHYRYNHSPKLRISLAHFNTGGRDSDGLNLGSVFTLCLINYLQQGRITQDSQRRSCKQRRSNRKLNKGSQRSVLQQDQSEQVHLESSEEYIR